MSSCGSPWRSAFGGRTSTSSQLSPNASFARRDRKPAPGSPVTRTPICTRRWSRGSSSLRSAPRRRSHMFMRNCTRCRLWRSATELLSTSSRSAHSTAQRRVVQQPEACRRNRIGAVHFGGHCATRSAVTRARRGDKLRADHLRGVSVRGGARQDPPQQPLRGAAGRGASTRCQAALRCRPALPLVHLGEFPSEASHHVERYSKDVLPCGDIDRVSREDISYRAARQPQRPHLERLSAEHFRRDWLGSELEVLQRNRVGVRRSHRLEFRIGRGTSALRRSVLRLGGLASKPWPFVVHGGSRTRFGPRKPSVEATPKPRRHSNQCRKATLSRLQVFL